MFSRGIKTIGIKGVKYLQPNFTDNTRDVA